MVSMRESTVTLFQTGGRLSLSAYFDFLLYYRARNSYVPVEVQQRVVDLDPLMVVYFSDSRTIVVKAAWYR